METSNKLYFKKVSKDALPNQLNTAEPRIKFLNRLTPKSGILYPPVFFSSGFVIISTNEVSTGNENIFKLTYIDLHDRLHFNMINWPNSF